MRGASGVWTGAALLLALAACDQPVTPPGPPAPEGTALANCTERLNQLSAGTVRISSVNIFEEQRGIISGLGMGRIEYGCFTNPQGEVVHVSVDRPFW